MKRYLPLLVLCLAHPVFAQTIQWSKPSGGSFTDSANWTGITVPTNIDTAAFGLDAVYTVTFTEDVSTAALNLTDGTVSFDLGGSTYSLAQPSSISGSSSASLILLNGILHAPTGLTYIGQSSGATGSVTVAGAGTQWIKETSDVVVGDDGGTGTLTIVDGGLVSTTHGYIGDGEGSNGSVVVTGVDSQWINPGLDDAFPSLTVGIRGGNGTLLVEAGGTVSSTNAIIGSEGSNGSAIVTGAGSQWINSTELIMGFNGGTSTLTIADGGSVSNTYGFIGYGDGSNGSVIVTGAGSQWSSIGALGIYSDLLVGTHGGRGTLLVEDGGKMISGDYLSGIGIWSGSIGDITITGAGSRWISVGDLIVGGKGGTGTFTIAGGGSVSNEYGFVGRSNGASGSVTVTGIGSQWNNTGHLIVGWGDPDSFIDDSPGAGDIGTGTGGTGLLIIADGGLVSNTNGSIGVGGPVGHSASGSVIVTGTDSHWINSGGVYVGFSGIDTMNGTGSLTIADGGSVSSAHGVIGTGIGSSGSATVTGIGSKWTNINNLNVGENGGTGALTVTDSGSVSSLSGIVNNGSVTVTGIDSQSRLSS